MLPRHCTSLSIPLLALPLSCTNGGSNDADDETESGGDPDLWCIDPGTTVAEVEPFVAPAGTPAPNCSNGWGSDAARRDPAWIKMIESDTYYYSQSPIVKGLSDRAALLITRQSLQWFDGQGGAGATLDHGFPTSFPGMRSNAVVVRDSDDHVFIAGPAGDDLVIREFADGAMVGELAVPTPGTGPRVAGLFEFSADQWLIIGDEFDPLEYGTEAFFMRVDANGNELLRKARPIGYSYYYSPLTTFAALDANEILLFGSTQQQWLVDPINGAVQNPSVGLVGLRDVVGLVVGAGFMAATTQVNASSDSLASLINGVGTNQWTQTYDRATTPDFVFDVDARPDGGFVMVGRDGIWWQPQDLQFNSQPWIIAFDGQGTAEWFGRLAIPGEARSVDVAGDGGIVAAGNARLGGTDYNNVDSFIWLAAW